MGIFKHKNSSSENSLPDRRQIARQNKESNDASRGSYSFRRNQTLTGSTSHSITSSNELNAQLSSPRAHVHMLAKTRRKLIGWLVLAALLAGLTYALLNQMVASVTVTIAGKSELSEQQQKAYVASIDQYYAARPVERLRILLDRPAFLAHIQALHPEVESLDLSPGDNFGTATVNILPRDPIARWSLSDGRQYVDESGTVFGVNYYEAPNLRIVDNSGIRTVDDTLVASNRFLGFVGRVAGLSSSNGYAIRQVVIPAQTTRQVEVRLKGESERYILSIDRSADEQAEDIARIAKYLDDTNSRPNYVDIRVKGKAFYK